MTIPEVIKALEGLRNEREYLLRCRYEELFERGFEALGVAIDVLNDHKTKGDCCCYCRNAKRLSNGWIHACKRGKKLPDLSHCKFVWRGKETPE